MNNQRGKLSVDGCTTPDQESKVLNKRAKISAILRKKYEAKHKFISIKIDPKTVILVEKSKYNSNKESYDNRRY